MENTKKYYYEISYNGRNCSAGYINAYNDSEAIARFSQDKGLQYLAKVKSDDEHFVLIDKQAAE
jgi:hypothetical protein